MERKLNIVHRKGRVLGEGWRVSASLFDQLNFNLENVSIFKGKQIIDQRQQNQVNDLPS